MRGIKEILTRGASTRRAEHALPPEVQNIIKVFNDRVREADANLREPEETKVTWVPLAKAAMELAQNNDHAKEWMFGGQISMIKEQTFLPSHIDRKILDEFVVAVVEAEQSRQAENSR